MLDGIESLRSSAANSLHSMVRDLDSFQHENTRLLKHFEHSIPREINETDRKVQEMVRKMVKLRASHMESLITEISEVCAKLDEQKVCVGELGDRLGSSAAQRLATEPRPAAASLSRRSSRAAASDVERRSTSRSQSAAVTPRLGARADEYRREAIDRHGAAARVSLDSADRLRRHRSLMERADDELSDAKDEVRRLRQRDSTANSRSSISRDRSRGRSRVQFDDEVEHRTDLRQLQRRLDQLARLHDDLPSTPQRSSQPLTPTAANGNVAEAYLQLYEQTVQKSFDFAKQVVAENEALRSAISSPQKVPLQQPVGLAGAKSSRAGAQSPSKWKPWHRH